jgi:SnoaL-like domain
MGKTMNTIELACQRLILEFSNAVDSRQYDNLREVFASNARFARPTDPDNFIEGVENIINAFKSRPATKVIQHLVTNMLVTSESSERAIGQCSILLFTADEAAEQVVGKGRKASAQLIGRYDDVYVLTPDGWRIAERRGCVTFNV